MLDIPKYHGHIICSHVTKDMIGWSFDEVKPMAYGYVNSKV